MRRNDRPAFRHRLDFSSALVAFRHRLDFNSALVAATAKERAARRSKRIFDYLVQKTGAVQSRLWHNQNFLIKHQKLTADQVLQFCMCKIAICISFDKIFALKSSALTMAAEVLTQNFNNLSIEITTGNKTCHMCMKDFISTFELQNHIQTDHELRHPTKISYEKLMSVKFLKEKT